MAEKNVSEDFIRESREVNRRGADFGIEDFRKDNLDDYTNIWILQTTCHDYVVGALSHLVHYKCRGQPDFLELMNTGEIDSRLEDIDLSVETYAHLRTFVGYTMARSVVALMFEGSVPADFALRGQAAVDGIYTNYTDESDIESRDELLADYFLLWVATRRYEEVITEFEFRDEFDLAKHENHHRTMIKECYMLSKIAVGDCDDDLVFGAKAYIALLKFNYYQYEVGLFRWPQVEFVRVILVSYLYEEITTGKLPEEDEFYASIAPEKVLAEMNAMSA